MSKRSVCSSCGMSAEGEQKFCSVCGNAMTVSDIPETNEAPAADAIPPVMQDAMNGSTDSFTDAIPPIPPADSSTASYNDDIMNGGNANTVHNNTGSFGGYSSYGGASNIPNINTYNTYNTTIPKPSSKKDGLAIGGLITGIASIVLCCFNCIDIPVAIVGLVISILGLKSESKKGCAIGGIITSIAGLLLSILIIVFAFSSGMVDEYENVYDEVYEEMYDDMHDDDMYDYEYYYD